MQDDAVPRERAKAAKAERTRTSARARGAAGEEGRATLAAAVAGAEAVAAAVEAAAASNLRGMSNMVPVTHHGCRVKSRVARGAASEGATEAVFMNLTK